MPTPRRGRHTRSAPTTRATAALPAGVLFALAAFSPPSATWQTRPHAVSSSSTTPHFLAAAQSIVAAAIPTAVPTLTVSTQAAHDAETHRILDQIHAHAPGVKSVNGMAVSDDEFHKHAVKHIGADYDEALAHIHVQEVTGDALKEALLAKDPDDELFVDDDDDQLNPAVVRRQLREQGVREENLERLTNSIVNAHKEERVRIHRTHAGSDEVVHDRMDGFEPMIAPEVTKAEFRKIDSDHDGRVYIKEVRQHFEKLLGELDHEGVHKMLYSSHYVQDTSHENVNKVHNQLREHYEEQLAGLDTVWTGSDLNNDGHISYPEYDRFVQEAHWLAHQEAVARKVLGEDMHLFDENWREEL